MKLNKEMLVAVLSGLIVWDVVLYFALGTSPVVGSLIGPRKQSNSNVA